MGNSLATAVDVIASPSEAFARLREKPTLLFPLVILAVLNAGIAFWYYNVVDLAWMLEEQMQASLPEGQPPGALGSSAAATVVGAVSAVSAAIALVLAFAIAAGYLAFVSMLTNDGHRFKAWFSLVAWCSLPLVLSQIAAGVNLLVNDASRMAPQELNPLSFASLLGVDPAAAGAVMNMNPIQLWVLVLVVLGYHAWTRRSVAAASAIVLGPVGVIVGLIVLLS